MPYVCPALLLNRTFSCSKRIVLINFLWHPYRWRRLVTCFCWGTDSEMQLLLAQLRPSPWVSLSHPAWAPAPCPPPPPSPHRSPTPPTKAPSRPARAAATTPRTSRVWWIVRRSWPRRWEESFNDHLLCLLLSKQQMNLFLTLSLLFVVLKCLRLLTHSYNSEYSQVVNSISDCKVRT